MVVEELERRDFLRWAAAGAVALLAAPAEASVARSVTLRELIDHSSSVVVTTPLEATSTWEELAGSRRIVTRTRTRIDELVRGKDPSSSEIVVRTLGGSVGKIAQRVEGQPELLAGTSCLLFTLELEPALFGVTALAQGHYPIVAEAARRIVQPSRLLPKLVGSSANSALRRLTGKPLAEALSIVRAERL